MQVSRKSVLAFTGLSSHTITRIEQSDPLFPPATTIGKSNYYGESGFYEWLNGRVSKGANQAEKPKITSADSILESKDIQTLLNRSYVWVWSNIVKTGKFARVNLSPDPETKNPRNYFIEREIAAAFPELIEIQEVA